MGPFYHTAWSIHEERDAGPVEDRGKTIIPVAVIFNLHGHFAPLHTPGHRAKSWMGGLDSSRSISESIDSSVMPLTVTYTFEDMLHHNGWTACTASEPWSGQAQL